jgi:hypothetical protein
MSQEIELYSRIQNPVEAIVQLGQYFAKSGFAGCQNEAQGIVLAWECAAKRKSPSDILAENHIVNGRMSRKSLAIAARFQEAGGKIKWMKTGEDGKEAEAQYSIEGETVTARFTIDDAKRQGLIDKNPNWKIRPGNMLRARCHTTGIGMLRPALVLGIEDESPESGEVTPRPLLPPKKSDEPKPARVEAVTTVADPNLERPSTTESQSAELPVQAPAVAVSGAMPASAVANAKPVVSNWTHPRDKNKVSIEGAAALGEMIPFDKQELALRWLESKGWIIIKGSLLDLSPDRAKKIYSNIDRFLVDITAPATQPA